MMQHINAFRYTDYNRKQCVCDLDVYSGSFVVVTERFDNHGMSITNAAELVATQIASRLGLDSTKLIYVEHYPADDFREEDTYDLVEFTWFDGQAHSPKWKPLPQSELVELISV